MRRSRSWLAAACCMLLASCATVPTSGPVQHHTPQAAGVNTGVHVDPLPPSSGASQLLVVEGFLHAMGAYQPGYEVARQYLTESASQSWHPESGIQVYADGYPPTEADQTVVLVAPLTGAIDPVGGYQGASGQLRHDFGLVKDVNGQWRISHPPDGLLVSRYLFSTSFLPINLHFLNASSSVLVPDPRFFAAGDQALVAAVKAQLAGPSAWLVPAVHKVETAGVAVESVALDSDGTVNIALGYGADSLTLEQRRNLLAEFAYTMVGFDQVSSIQVTSGGQRWISEFGQTQVRPDSFTGLSPADVSAPRILFIVRDKKLQRLRDPKSWNDFAAVDADLERIEDFAVRGDGGEVAAVTGGGTRLIGSQVGTGKARTLRIGVGLLRPDYARNGDLWSPVAAGINGLRVYRQDAALEVDAGKLPAVPVVAAKLSPDGSRLALVLRRGNRTEVGIALVQASDTGIVVSGWRSLDVTLSAGTTGQALDVGWASETELAVLQAGSGGETSVIRVSQDGATATDIGPSDTANLGQLAVVSGRPAVALAAAGAAYRFDGEFNWALVLTSVDAVAYSG